MAIRLSTIASNATYNLTRSVAAVDEGSQVTVTLNTTGVQNQQTIPYTISGTNITTGDFVALPSLSNNFTVQNNTATAILTANADVTTEGSETFAVTLNDTGTTVSVNINDTSIAPSYPQTQFYLLNNPTPASEDQFGHSVAISGNYAIVGPTGNVNQAYIYNVATGALVWTLNNPGTAGAWFGNRVAISGNYAIVGAQGDGKAYIYNVTTGALVWTLDNPSNIIDDQFSFSVAISGNYAVVSAYYRAVGATGAGYVYIFDVTTGMLVRGLGNPTPATYEGFGNSVAISGNYVIVGCSGEDSQSLESGKSYIFDVSTGALLWTLDNPTPFANDYFGTSVGISGNYAIVGAPGDEATYVNNGSAYIFNVTTGALVWTWNPSTPVVNPNGAYFGKSVAISGNYAIVGAPWYSSPGNFYNVRVYVYDVTTGALVGTLENSRPQITGSYFGESVGISGNYAIVGTPRDDVSASTAAGSAYIFN